MRATRRPSPTPDILGTPLAHAPLIMAGYPATIAEAAPGAPARRAARSANPRGRALKRRGGAAIRRGGSALSFVSVSRGASFKSALSSCKAEWSSGRRSSAKLTTLAARVFGARRWGGGNARKFSATLAKAAERVDELWVSGGSLGSPRSWVGSRASGRRFMRARALLFLCSAPERCSILIRS